MNGPISGDQIGGMVRVVVPMLLTALVAFGVMDKTAVEALTEPIVAIAGGVAVIATAGAAAWSIYVNQQGQIVKAAAAIDPKNIQINVGPKAPDSIQAVAKDLETVNVVPDPTVK